MSPHASVISRKGTGAPAGKSSPDAEGLPDAEVSPQPPYPAYVTDRIRRLRVKSGLSQEEVADRMGIRQQTYSEYERGISHMHIEEFVSPTVPQPTWAPLAGESSSRMMVSSCVSTDQGFCSRKPWREMFFKIGRAHV